MCDGRRRSKCALMQANQRVSPPLRSQSTGSTVCDASAAQFILPKPPRRGDRGLTIGGHPANVGLVNASPNGDTRKRQETPLFAKSIERHALKTNTAATANA